MKRKVLLVAAIVTGSFAFAQEEGGSSFKDKNGQEVLPQAGDMAIGFSTGAFPSISGNSMTSNVNTNTGPVPVSVTTITMKKFSSSTSAIRASLGLNFGSTSSETGTGAALVETTNSVTGFAIGGGIEKRKGAGRVQAVYGAQASVGFASTNTENVGTTVTTTETGSVFSLGLNGFLGAEYFFAPKFSIGAEYSLGLNMTSNGDSESTSTAVGATNITNPGASAFNFGTGSTTASIIFHF